jgi:hypothetical protein
VSEKLGPFHFLPPVRQIRWFAESTRAMRPLRTRKSKKLHPREERGSLPAYRRCFASTQKLDRALLSPSQKVRNSAGSLTFFVVLLFCGQNAEREKAVERRANRGVFLARSSRARQFRVDFSSTAIRATADRSSAIRFLASVKLFWESASYSASLKAIRRSARSRKSTKSKNLRRSNSSFGTTSNS